MVSQTDMDQALSDAASDNTATGAGRLPHSSAPVLTVAAKAGLVQTAGQDLLYSANDTLTLASGQDTHLATGGAHRIHSGQAIGVLGGVIQAGQEAAGKGLTLIAAQGDTVLQAQAGPLQVASQGTLTVQSASAHIDWASAKKITLSTASGANITLEGGNITVQCPGTITVKAGTKSFAGGGSESYSMPTLATGGGFMRKYVVQRATDQQPLVQQKYRMTLDDGRVIEGITNGLGETSLAESDGMQQVKIELLFD